MGKRVRAVPSFPQVKTRLELSEPAPWAGMHPAHAPPLCHPHAAVDGGGDLHAFIGHLNVSLVTWGSDSNKAFSQSLEMSLNCHI